MNCELLDWTDWELDIDNSSDVIEEVDPSSTHTAPLLARQKLEIYWERKRLEENLYDVLGNTKSMSSITRRNNAENYNAI
jgi:hypothetical protein